MYKIEVEREVESEVERERVCVCVRAFAQRHTSKHLLRLSLTPDAQTRFLHLINPPQKKNHPGSPRKQSYLKWARPRTQLCCCRRAQWKRTRPCVVHQRESPRGHWSFPVCMASSGKQGPAESKNVWVYVKKKKRNKAQVSVHVCVCVFGKESILGSRQRLTVSTTTHTPTHVRITPATDHKVEVLGVLGDLHARAVDCVNEAEQQQLQAMSCAAMV